MFLARNLQRHSVRALTFLISSNPTQNAMKWQPIDGNFRPAFRGAKEAGLQFTSSGMWNCFDGARGMSRKSMRSKVEARLIKESGKTLRERRRASKLRKKLMTDEERLLYNLRRAKKKVALLLQKLKKYELPELPSPKHDPELLTPEQLQAYKKIGYKNRNYVPVGVRGVFGGVVQNMHLHWKFHETVQVCCDNFPKEKIKEMASMLARLSGGIVVNIHNVKTIIMFRGRNYRQPKNLIPINTLTKRKALFKARFEQALDSQKLNIKEYEQKLRKKGINPDDPVAMASIQRVASTFFNAIDKKEGTPYVFQGDKSNQVGASISNAEQQSDEESDQEELDRFIAEIEREADREWAAEEAAEKEELGKIRYWNQEDFGGRFKRSESNGSDESDNEMVGRTRNWNDKRGRKVVHDDSDEDGDGDVSEDDDGWDSDDTRGTSNYDTHNGEYKSHDKSSKQNIQSWPKHKTGKDRGRGQGNSNIYGKPKFDEKMSEEPASDDMLSDLENAMWESDDGDEQSIKESNDYRTKQMNKNERNGGKKRNVRKLKGMDDWDSD
ncbi:uncharacterized CRM domain-containing protein At3g25440, chloroplastic [Ipomoea triloba]|uniref:uncharacterized CRM domain-containing protein At3g25440, chloroplastic n=1 Tax=Ipomoea triloba TaxID=35885 RepID=UPI00125DA137|nr:uncharacterized CRM domain-containing protein At3g25440, chloroplastic [Ipomoea triloba]